MNTKNFKKTNGVTLAALVVTIIVLAIIASIAIYSGKEMVEKAQIEELKTNMLLIQAKSKEYVEKVNFKIGIDSSKKTDEEKQTIRDEIYGTASEDGAQLEKATDIPANFKISNTSTCYWLTPAAQKKWGLEQIELEEKERYLIQFNETEETVEIYNTIGYEGKYSLTDINKMKIKK